MAERLISAERREVSTPPAETRMWAKQAALPRLPVPDLGQTCMRYLRSVRPLLSGDEYRATIDAVAAFAVGGKGEELQRRLEKRRQEKHGSSWLADWWNQRAYLSDREPVVFFVSYFYAFKRLTTLPPSPPLVASGRLQCAVAAAIVRAALLFKEKIDSGTLEPDVVAGVPQCMSAYPFLFNSSRVPATPSDFVATHYTDHASSHIIAARHGRFYKVCTRLPSGKLASQEELAGALLAVVQAADAVGQVELPIGALSGADRDLWATSRAALCVSAQNSESFLALEKAALLVCLDHDYPHDSGEAGANARARVMWHGDGVNRFYDKTLQFIVLPDGNAGFLGEHALADGAPTLRLCSEVLPAARRSLAGVTGLDAQPVRSEGVRELAWDGLELVSSAIGKARAAFVAEVQDHQTARVAVKGLGRTQIKNLGVAPDPFCQLAMQVAFCRLHNGRVPATYEACSTRRFLHGRTETIRACSLESTAFAGSMAADSLPPARQAYAMLRGASEQHRRNAAECSRGMGVDRHLLGLKLCLQPGEEIPALFTDKAFAMSSRWELSTSHLPSDHFESWGFGEVVREGLGCGYSCNTDETVFFVSCRVPASGVQRAAAFAQAVQQAMVDMAKLCEAASATSKL